MAKSWLEIRHIMQARRSYDQQLIRRMIDVKDRANGDMAVPMITLPGEPEFDPLAPQLIADGIDATAMRANGPFPTIHCPAVNQAKEHGKNSLEYAAIRRRALYARWFTSDMDIIMARGYRQLAGYGTFALVVMPDPVEECARVHLRDPLSAYPEVRTPEDMRAPRNVGFVYGKSPEWIIARYPQARQVIEARDKGKNFRTGDDAGLALWDMLEWIDEDDIVVGILGPRTEYLQAPTSVTPSDVTMELGHEGQELKRWANKAGMVPVSTPRRVTLDRIAGQMETVIPMVDWLQRLMALEVAAAERSVFPDVAIIGDQNQVPKLVSGQWQDGRTGKPNLLEGVKAIQNIAGGPTPMAMQATDRLERNARQSGRVSPMYGGESMGSSLRTGRALDSMAGFSIDPGVQELQRIMQVGLRELNAGILAVEKGYYGSKTFSVYSGWPSERGQVEYTPNKHFETYDNSVAYAFPGSDVSQITVGVGQMVAAKLMSKHTGRDKHPWIEDAENEERYILLESLQDAMMMATQQKLAAGEMPLEVMGAIYKDIQKGVPEMEAITKAIDQQKELQAQAAQAAQQQAQGGGPPGGGEPGMPPEVDPAMQRGVGPPGTAPAEEAATIAGPNPGQRNLSALVRAVAAPARQVQNTPRTAAPAR